MAEHLDNYKFCFVDSSEIQCDEENFVQLSLTNRRLLIMMLMKNIFRMNMILNTKEPQHFFQFLSSRSFGSLLQDKKAKVA